MTLSARTLAYKGASLYATIPKEITEKLNLKEGQELIFIHEGGKNFAIIGTKDILKFKDADLKKIAPTALGLFSNKIDKDDLDLILQEMAKED